MFSSGNGIPALKKCVVSAQSGSLWNGKKKIKLGSFDLTQVNSY